MWAIGLVLDVFWRRSEIGRAHVELQSPFLISYAVFCLKKKIAVRALSEAGRRVDDLAEVKRAFGPCSVPQPLAPAGVRGRADSEQIGPGALHAVRAGVDVGDSGIVRVLARKRDAHPEQARGEAEREVQRLAGAVHGLVAAPQRDETRLARPGLLADAAQLSRRDRGAKRGNRGRERRGVESQLFECFAHDSAD